MEEKQNLKTMVNKLHYLMYLFFIISCKKATFNNNKFHPEISINNSLYLKDGISINNFYKDYKNLNIIHSLRETPIIIFADKQDKEYLIAYQYEGDAKNEFSLFEIGYIKNDPRLIKNINKTTYDIFKTESGLCLGLDLKDILSLKGTPSKVIKKQDKTILIYEINIQDDKRISKYNMPSYYMHIYTKNNKTYKIIFGFGYP
ncbi:MAG: hypothetical protein ACTTJM_01840 [Bergeyella cardium]